jgi:phenylalanyl-tRNA synthetase beta chain
MVVVEYLYEEMKALVDMPLDKMIDGLNRLGAPSEYDQSTRKITSELTPNRPDWYSMEGLSRALKAFHKGKRTHYTAESSDYRIIVDPSVSKVRPYTACGIAKGLKMDDKRIRDLVLLQEKLLGTLGRKVKRFGIGIYPLEHIAFPLRYTTLNPEEISYVPLGFEKEMRAEEILEHHKKGQQYGHIIKDAKRYPVFIDAKDRIMCLIPIVNSAETGKVDIGTSDIFVEVSGMDPYSCKTALNIIMCTLADMEGTLHQTSVEYKGRKEILPDLKEKRMRLDLKKACKLLGISLKHEEMEVLLHKMGYGYEKGEILIPPFRADVMAQVDVIEDIAIAYGYDRFVPTLPDFFHSGKVDRSADSIHSAMRGMGFLEITTFILSNKEKVRRSGYDGKLIEISNPSSVDFTVVRPTLISDMLDTFATNKMQGLPQRYYEIGVVNEKEKRLIFGVMDKKVEFSQFRGVLQTLAKEMGAKAILGKKEHPAFQPEESCLVIMDGKERGVLGKVKKETLASFGVEHEAFICEIRL